MVPGKKAEKVGYCKVIGDTVSDRGVKMWVGYRGCTEVIGGKKGEKGAVLWWFNKGQEHLDLELICGAKKVSKIDFLLLISLVQVVQICISH